jgi:hypothetical protein
MTQGEFDRYIQRRRRLPYAYDHSFDPSALALQFVPWFELDRYARTKIKVQRTYSDGSTFVRVGSVGITTGWRPCFLLMHSARSLGSSACLSSQDQIIAVKKGDKYVAIT